MGIILSLNKLGSPQDPTTHTTVRFKPYSTDTTVPLLGCMDVKLINNRGKAVKTRVYVTQGQKGSLLDKDDAITLGIVKIDPDGDKPEDTYYKKVRCITPDHLGHVRDGCLRTRGLGQRCQQARFS